MQETGFTDFMGTSKFKKLLFKLYEDASILSLKAAVREQHLEYVYQQLNTIVPDIENQYTDFQVDTPYLEAKVRALHSFQVKFTLNAIEAIIAERQEAASGRRPFTIADIGDSAGTHITYLKGMLSDDERFSQGIECISVNLDKEAVKRITSRGLKAVCCKAEDLHKKNIRADLFISFEMLEHLYSPVDFLDSISRESKCDFLVITVPYLARSRVGLHHIRNNQKIPVIPEGVHIFELSPADWKLLAKHSGWQVLSESVFSQFPRRSFWRVMQPVWKRMDFEGFYAMLLERNRTWANCYHAE